MFEAAPATPVWELKEEVSENKIPQNENKEQKEIPEFKPRVRGR